MLCNSTNFITTWKTGCVALNYYCLNNINWNLLKIHSFSFFFSKQPLKNRLSILTFLLNMGHSADQSRDRHFSFPDMRLGLNSPVASTSRKWLSFFRIWYFSYFDHSLYLFNFLIFDSGQTSQTSCPQGQIVPLSCTETVIRGPPSHPARIFNEESVPEDLLVQDLIYSFQGIEGKVLKLDASYAFQIDPRANVNRTHRQAVLRLSALGYLHNVVTRGLERMAAASAGRVADSFLAALHQELSEYYRFIAIMQEEVNRWLILPSIKVFHEMIFRLFERFIIIYDYLHRAQGPLGMDGVTLSHLHLWAYEPLESLKWLASIVKACEGQKGGALASAVYGFSHHGDAGVKQLVKRILEKVCDPLHTMLVRWIAEGELDDPRKEFFIEARSDVAGDRMWHEKYQVRDSMVPSFITKAQARKILGTGKSINFLREVCKDSAPLQERHRESFQQNAEDSNGINTLVINRVIVIQLFSNIYQIQFSIFQLKLCMTWILTVPFKQWWKLLSKKRRLELSKF